MDNFLNNRGTKNNSKRELYLFNSALTNVQNIISSRRNVRTLVIICQRDVRSFYAISELTHIQELWIVDCGLKDIPPFKKNCPLKKLYLYSNEISCISNLDACTCLTVLYLSGNNINNLQVLTKLSWLEDLNLANNKLKRIGKCFSTKSQLLFLNLAGNQLCFIKDIRNLSQLQKLKFLVFADPLYGECPIVGLCNYRAYVINYLPNIKKLDHYIIYDKEKRWINQFFKKQITYHNVLFHKQLSEYLELLKDDYKEYKKEMLYFKDQLYVTNVLERRQNCLKEKTHDDSLNIILKMEISKQRFIEKKKMAIVQSKIMQQQLVYNINHCGNINFIEYHATPKNTIIQLCKQFLEESLCTVIKNDIGITGLILYKVTEVYNREIDQLKLWNGDNMQINESNVILKILTSPGVTNIQAWPFNFFKTGLLYDVLIAHEELTVTNCLALADCAWLHKLIISRKNGDILNLLNSVESRRVCILIQIPIFSYCEKTYNANDCLHTKHGNYRNNANKTCQKFVLTNKNIRNPIFIIEYGYTLQELTNENKHNKFVAPCTLDSTMCVCLSNSNITKCINSNKNVETCELVEICLSGQSINSISINLNLPNMRICDISFNCLQEFPNSNFMKNVIILNISFNNIQSIHITEVLPQLEELNVSWNCISNCLANIEMFTTCTPNMLKLKICNNPFEDVDPEFVEYVLYTYIPNLQYINDSERTNLNLPQKHYPCAINMCRPWQRNNLFCFDLEENVIENKEKSDLSLIQTNMKYVKYIHVSQDSVAVLDILKKSAKIQELCATCCSLIAFYIKMPLKHLTKLNLGSNFISVLNQFTQENFPSLKYFDLTNNLITSLRPMGSFCTLQEFYCSNNKIENLSQIDNVKTWQMLHVIDLSNNPIHNKALIYKKFIICHLNNIEYISGESVQRSDITEVRYISDRKLDNYVLHTVYKTDQLTTITQLSITNCSLSKVDLSADLLPQLESLDLSKNKITFFWGLHSFQYLHTLCLSYNCIETFDNSNYGESRGIYPKLCTLLLDHNHIKSLMNINEQLPVIKHLFLNNNHLQNINGLNHCSSLESLILDHNQIDTLNLDFIEDNNLKFLSFENNKIKSLKFTNKLQKLEKLYAANNCLMNDNEMQHLFLLENLVELTFEGNHLFTEMNKDRMIAQNFDLTNPEIVRN